MYDHSIRVPTFVRWPGKVKAGVTIRRTVTNLDWFPTFAAIAGAELPHGAVIRGRNIVPALTEGPDLKWDDSYYGEYSTKHQSRTHMRAWRTARWKLVRDFLNPGRDELFDLKNDPAEAENLINSDRADAKKAARQLHARILNADAENQDSGSRRRSKLNAGVAERELIAAYVSGRLPIVTACIGAIAPAGERSTTRWRRALYDEPPSLGRQGGRRLFQTLLRTATKRTAASPENWMRPTHAP